MVDVLLNGLGFECCIMSESFRTLGPGGSLEASKASDYIPMLKTVLMSPQATNARSMTAPDTHVLNTILCIDVTNIIEYFPLMDFL